MYKTTTVEQQPNNYKPFYVYEVTGEGGSTTPEPEPEPEPETPDTTEEPEAKVITVAEFIAAPEAKDVYYELTGTIGGTINTTYGNFDLTDETGTVYVYGLTKEFIAVGSTQNDKSYSSLGLKEGDKITIRGFRGSYNGKIEVMGAYFVKLVEAGETPEPETPSVETVGDGTEANPFTVEDVIALNNTLSGKQYVKAYIVGQVNGASLAAGAEFEAPFTPSTNSSTGEQYTYNTNLLIASSADETDPAKCVPVQLPSGDVRTNFNLPENPDMDGKLVLINGDLIKYFTVPGIKNTVSIVVLEEEVEEPEVYYETFVMNNLEVTPISDELEFLEASDPMTGLSVQLGIYADGSLHEDCYIDYGGTELPIISGSATKEYNADVEADLYTVRVIVDLGGEKMGLELLLYAGAVEAYDVVVTETTLSMEYGALIMKGVWTNPGDGLDYPFKATIGGWNCQLAEAEVLTSIEVGDFENDPWLGFGEGKMTLTNEEGFLTLTGEITTNSGPVLNVTAYGMTMIMEMDVEAQLTEMEMGGVNYLNLNGTDKNSAMSVDLYLNNYTGQDKTYTLNEESTVAGGISVYGDITKSGNTYTGVAYAETGEGLYVLPMTLAEFAPEYENIVITGLSGAAEARDLGWGEYYLALSLEGTWSDGVDTYPVLLEITDGYDATTTSGTMTVSLTIGGWGDDDPWLGSADGELSYTLSGQNITLKGKLESPWMGIYWDVTLTGTILPNYTRNVTAGNFGTICLPFGGMVKGATLWELAKAETDQVLLVSANKLEAGVPYIFEATATQIAVYCDATVADAAGEKNGLHGTFDDNTVVDNGNYIVYENKLCEVASTSWVNANRAYVVMSEVPTSHTPMPGRKYMGMSTQSENEATGLDNINGANDIVKMIENGQLIIVIDGVKYNAQGVRF
jgi:hypothetical protein